jgi:hypothetical protein
VKAFGLLQNILRVTIWVMRAQEFRHKSLIQCAGPATMYQDIEIEMCIMLVIHPKVSGRPPLAHITVVRFDKVELVG